MVPWKTSTSLATRQPQGARSNPVGNTTFPRATNLRSRPSPPITNCDNPVLSEMTSMSLAMDSTLPPPMLEEVNSRDWAFEPPAPNSWLTPPPKYPPGGGGTIWERTFNSSASRGESWRRVLLVSFKASEDEADETPNCLLMA
eukprot:scaffold2262_cov303-Alexandrium_tamarense.AAC.1